MVEAMKDFKEKSISHHLTVGAGIVTKMSASSALQKLHTVANGFLKHVRPLKFSFEIPGDPQIQIVSLVAKSIGKRRFGDLLPEIDVVSSHWPVLEQHTQNVNGADIKCLFDHRTT